MPIDNNPINIQISDSIEVKLSPTNSFFVCFDEPSITWTCRTQSEPQLVENNSIVAGDHIIINATFPEIYNIINCTLHIWNGINYNVSSNETSVTVDTYYLYNQNQSYNILAKGISNTNVTTIIFRENVSVCNFFAPVVTVYPPVVDQENNRIFNITWSSSDLNADDMNYYQVWISTDWVSYMLIANNITNTWYVWDSSGWLEGEYVVRIRAYSLDFTSELCSVDAPPTSYWPGDFSDGFYYPLYTDVPTYTVTISYPADTSYYYGTTGNNVSLTLVFNSMVPSSLEYDVTNNGTPWFSGNLHPTQHTDLYVFNIDGLPIGIHIISIIFHPYFGDIIRTFTVTVSESTTSQTTTQSSTNTGSLIFFMTIGISIMTAGVIISKVFFTSRKTKNALVIC